MLLFVPPKVEREMRPEIPNGADVKGGSRPIHTLTVDGPLINLGL
jgi:hypothetical protein